MSDPLIQRYAHDGWLEVALNRPERKNAVIGPMVEALIETLDGADRDPGVRVVLLRGEGGAFCSGLDLKEFNADPPPSWLPDFQPTWRRLHERIYSSSTPIVGALERYAINGGAALALACDLLVCGETAFLQVGEVQGGMPAPMNVAWLRLRHAEAVAAQVALVGGRLTGRELFRLGIAQQSVPDDAVLEEARTLTAQLASHAEGGLSRIKSSIRAYSPAQAKEWFDRAASADPLRRFNPSKAKA